MFVFKFIKLIACNSLLVFISVYIFNLDRIYAKRPETPVLESIQQINETTINIKWSVGDDFYSGDFIRYRLFYSSDGFNEDFSEWPGQSIRITNEISNQLYVVYNSTSSFDCLNQCIKTPTCVSASFENINDGIFFNCYMKSNKAKLEIVNTQADPGKEFILVTDYRNEVTIYNVPSQSNYTFAVTVFDRTYDKWSFFSEPSEPLNIQINIQLDFDEDELNKAINLKWAQYGQFKNYVISRYTVNVYSALTNKLIKKVPIFSDIYKYDLQPDYVETKRAYFHNRVINEEECFIRCSNNHTCVRYAFDKSNNHCFLLPELSISRGYLKSVSTVAHSLRSESNEFYLRGLAKSKEYLIELEFRTPYGHVGHSNRIQVIGTDESDTTFNEDSEASIEKNQDKHEDSDHSQGGQHIDQDDDENLVINENYDDYEKPAELKTTATSTTAHIEKKDDDEEEYFDEKKKDDEPKEDGNEIVYDEYLSGGADKKSSATTTESTTQQQDDDLDNKEDDKEDESNAVNKEEVKQKDDKEETENEDEEDDGDDDDDDEDDNKISQEMMEKFEIYFETKEAIQRKSDETFIVKSLNSQIDITCVIIGDDDLINQGNWFKLDDNGMAHIIGTINNEQTDKAIGVNKLQIEIESLKRSDEGKYYCGIVGKPDKMREIKLIVTDVPSKPVIKKLDIIGENLIITFTLADEGGLNLLNALIEWSDTEFGENKESVKSKTIDLSHPGRLTDLGSEKIIEISVADIASEVASKQSFYVQMSLLNEHGWSTKSDMAKYENTTKQAIKTESKASTESKFTLKTHGIIIIVVICVIIVIIVIYVVYDSRSNKRRQYDVEKKGAAGGDASGSGSKSDKPNSSAKDTKYDPVPTDEK